MAHARPQGVRNLCTDLGEGEKEKKLMAETNVQRQDVVVIRVLDAPVERAWQAWTDPELVKRWWGPNGFSAPVAKIDFREGGISLVCMRAPAPTTGRARYVQHVGLREDRAHGADRVHPQPGRPKRQQDRSD